MSVPILMHPPYDIEVPDISNWQNFDQYSQPRKIDFAKVATNPKVRAIMIKFGEGAWDGYPINVALDQANGFHNVGLPIIPYHFWHIEATAIDQARYFKRRVALLSWKPRRYMVDIEDTDPPEIRPPTEKLKPEEYPIWIPKALKIAISVRDTMDAISQEFGETPLWYGGAWYQDWWVWLAGVDGLDMSWISKYKLQCASYTSPYMALCSGFTMDQVLFWQRTSRPPLSEQIQGFPFPGALDMNSWLLSEAEWKEYIDEKPGVITMSGIFDKSLSNKEKWNGAWLGMEDKFIDIPKVCDGSDFLMLNCVSQICPESTVIKDSAFPIFAARATKPVGLVVDLDQDLFWKKEITLPVFQDPLKRNMWNNETLRAILEQWRRNEIPESEWTNKYLNVLADDGGWHDVHAIMLRESTLRNHGDVINGVWQTAVLDDLLKPLTTLMEGGYIPNVPIFLMSNAEWFAVYAYDNTWQMKARLANGQLKGVGMIRKWGEDGNENIVTDKAPMASQLPFMEDVWQYVPTDAYTYPWSETGINYDFFVFSFNRFMVTDIFYPGKTVTPVTAILGAKKVNDWYLKIGWSGSTPGENPGENPNISEIEFRELQASVKELVEWRLKMAGFWPTIPK